MRTSMEPGGTCSVSGDSTWSLSPPGLALLPGPLLRPLTTLRKLCLPRPPPSVGVVNQSGRPAPGHVIVSVIDLMCWCCVPQPSPVLGGPFPVTLPGAQAWAPQFTVPGSCPLPPHLYLGSCCCLQNYIFSFEEFLRSCNFFVSCPVRR